MHPPWRAWRVALGVGLLGALTVWFWLAQRDKPPKPRTVADRLEEFGQAASHRLRPHFAQVGAPFPPARMTLLGFKEEKRLEVYVPDSRGSWIFLRSYPILGASGGPGPKLREGDRQVPEGIYTIELLNPNSRFHVSLRVGYPNAFDRQQAEQEGRTNLGGDIMIHGGTASIGCLAMSDPVAEEIFFLAAQMPLESMQIVLAPVDFRRCAYTEFPEDTPSWVPHLYQTIQAKLDEFPLLENLPTR